MENPAHVYTTGIPMSKKGNFAHIKNGCALDETLDDDSGGKIVDHGNLNNSDLNITNSSIENGDYINSIQDGFQQSEIMCGFTCDAGLQPGDLPMANSSLEAESIPESDSHIKFPDSPGSSFSCKIESFSSIEALVPSLDAQIDSYLSGLQKVNKSQSDDGGSVDEHRNVTDAISAIAESFGLEDFLPENFQTHDNKDLPSAVIGDSLCDGGDNIGGISLVDFEKCSTLHSPGSSLDLSEQLPDDAHSFELNGLDMLVTPSQSRCKSLESSPVKHSGQLKEEEKIFINSKEICNFKIENNSLVLSDDKVTCELTFGNSLIKAEGDDVNLQSGYDLAQASCTSQSSDVGKTNEDLELDIPTVRITDIHSMNSSEGENCSSAGTVLITCDKASKKMQIVLTLEQGQQIFDIDTGSIDANEQSMDLGLQNVLSEEQLQEDEQNGVELSGVDSSELEQYTEELDPDKCMNLPDDEDTSFDPSNFVELVSDFPATGSKKRRGKTFICPTEGCGQILDKECKLRVHMLGHKLVSRPFKCEFEGCDWAFTTPYRLRRHAETHLGSKDYTCDVEGCNRKFTTVYNLNTHIKRHKWANSLMCPSKDCKMSFSNRRRLELHLRVHKDVEAPYKCSICGKQYYSANCIASHVRTHQYSEDDFKCPFQDCGKVYDKICRLRQHIRYHTGDRPYACPAAGCHWSFMSASKLTRHMRKHTGERKFMCTEPGCGKSFMRPEHLKGHIVIHSGDKPFHCPHENCDARFTAKSSLYVHLKKHCPSVLKVVFYCPIISCNKKYNTKSALKQHLQKHHPEIVDEWNEMNITEKLSVKMPESPSNMNSESPANMEFDDDSLIDDPDDPRNLKVGMFQSDDSSVPGVISLVSLGATSIDPAKINNPVEKTNKTVPKATKNRAQNRQTPSSSASKSTSKVVKTSDKLIQENQNGCARTDFVCNRSFCSQKIEQPMSFISFNQNSIDSHDTRSFLTNSQMITEIKSPDIMLTSSIIYHDQSSDQLMKNNFLQDDCSTSHSLYHDDSILAGSSTFDTELIPASLLSDDVGSDESELNHSSGVVFSEQNSVDAFAESIHLHGLD